VRPDQSLDGSPVDDREVRAAVAATIAMVALSRLLETSSWIGLVLSREETIRFGGGLHNSRSDRATQQLGAGIVQIVHLGKSGLLRVRTPQSTTVPEHPLGLSGPNLGLSGPTGLIHWGEAAILLTKN
jgi:hypothetical protein